MKINKLNIIVFEKLLKLLLIAHLIILIKWKYYIFNSKNLFKYSLIDILDFNSAVIHYTLFGVFITCILLFCFNIKKTIALFIIAFSFLYFILSDVFLFHHDIFFAANITLLSALLIKYKNSEVKKTVVLAFKCLFTIVMFFSFFHKLNSDFHNGLLINNLISNNSFFAHFIDLKNNLLLNKLSPVVAKTTIFAEGIVPVLLWTRYRYIGASIGCLLHFGICFGSGAGVMFNLYLPLLYLFFIPIKKVELSSTPFNRFLKSLDFYGGIILVENKYLGKLKQTYRSYFIFLPSNIFFILLIGLYIFNILRCIYNILFVQ